MQAVLSAVSVRLHRIRLRILRHRRLLAALAVGLATWVGVQAATAPASPESPVWTLARDLPGGAVLARSDLQVRGFLPGTVPPGAVSDPATVIGRPLAHAVDRGQPLAESMVLGEQWVDDQDGATVVPVRISDPTVVELLRVGDHVDLYATEVAAAASTPGAELLATGVRVAAIPDASDRATPGALPGRLVLLALPESRVGTVTSAAARQFLSVAWRR